MRSLKLFTTLLLCLIVFLSCDDQKVAVTKESPLSPNPYEYLGKIHNDGLEILKNMNNKSTRSIDDVTSDNKEEVVSINLEEFTVDYINKCMAENGEDPQLRAGIESVVTYTKNNLSVIRDICGSSDESCRAINSLNLSASMKDAFEQIIQIISNEDTIVTKRAFAVFDNNIINDTNISVLDKEAILSVSAIAKDSYLYWAVNANSVQTRGLFHIVALADLGGAITSVASGFFSGAANTGLVFGPGGLVLTYAGLAVSGAFYSSALSAISGGIFSSIAIDDVPVPSE